MADLFLFGFLALFGLSRRDAKRRKAFIQSAQAPFRPKDVFGHHGDGFATNAECAKGKLFAWSGMHLGFSEETGREFKYGRSEANGIVVGPTGCGKTSGQ